MLINKLEKFGLSTKEAKVYLVLLSNGTSPVSDISKKSKINRSTTYTLLKTLEDRGLITCLEKGGIKLYSPMQPEKMIDLARDQLKKYQEIVFLGETILPELKLISSETRPRPRARFLDGVEGLREAYEDTLTSSETIRAYASIENMHLALPNYFPSYYHRRAEKNIHIRAIFPDTAEAKERITHNKAEERTSLLVPKNSFNFSPEINIYDNKIVFMSLVEKFALIIESKELADALKKVFELSWLGAKKLDKS